MPNDPLPDPRPCVPLRAAGEPRTTWEHGSHFAGSEVLLSRKVRMLDNAMIRWPQDSLDYWEGEGE